MSSIDSWRRKQQRKKRGALIAVALLAAVAVLAGFMWWNGSSNHDKKQGSSTKPARSAVADADVRRQLSSLEVAIKRGDFATQANFVSGLFREDFLSKKQLLAPKGTVLHCMVGGATDKNTFITDTPGTAWVDCLMSGKTYRLRLAKEDKQWRIVGTTEAEQ